MKYELERRAAQVFRSYSSIVLTEKGVRDKEPAAASNSSSFHFHFLLLSEQGRGNVAPRQVSQVSKVVKGQAQPENQGSQGSGRTAVDLKQVHQMG